MRVPHSQPDKTFHVSLVTARNGCRTPLSEHAAGIPSNPDLKKNRYGSHSRCDYVVLLHFLVNPTLLCPRKRYPSSSWMQILKHSSRIRDGSKCRDRSLLQILSCSMAPHQSNVAVALKLLKAYFAKQPSKSNAWSLSSKLGIDFKPNFGTHPKFVPGCPLNSHLTNSKCF